MKQINISRKKKRQARHKKILKKFKMINNGLLRLQVTKTNLHIYAQIINDMSNTTVISSSSLALKLKNGNQKNAKLVGFDLAQKALAKDITKINFDCGGSKYHGRVAMLAQGAREKGLKF